MGDTIERIAVGILPGLGIGLLAAVFILMQVTEWRRWRRKGRELQTVLARQEQEHTSLRAWVDGESVEATGSVIAIEQGVVDLGEGSRRGVDYEVRFTCSTLLDSPLAAKLRAGTDLVTLACLVEGHERNRAPYAMEYRLDGQLWGARPCGDRLELTLRRAPGGALLRLPLPERAATLLAEA